jgi:filamentous hemagglutinin family protein
MNKYNGFKVAALAASIALAMVASSAMAAEPAAKQLPGQGAVTAATAPTVDFTTTPGTMAIALGSNTVIDWGAGTGAEGLGNVNSTGVAGFNIGSGATVNFSGLFPVLNIDSTGNQSQIFGALNSAAGTTTFVANSNGIIVGSTGVITGGVGLVANTLIDDADAFNLAGNVVNFQGTGGDVTVQKGAQISGPALVVLGGSTVNVDLTGVTAGSIAIGAGLHGGTNPLAVDNDAASVTVTGAAGGSTVTDLMSAGTATTNGKLTVTANDVAGLLTNTGDLTLPVANGDVHNQGKLTTTGAADFGALTNDGTYTVVGGGFTGTGDLTNNGSIVGAGSVTVTNGSIVNNGSMTGVTDLNTISDTEFKAGAAYSITNAGSITGAGSLGFDANSVPGGGTKDDTTGSFVNAGTLSVGALGSLDVVASGDISLGGTLKVGGKANSAANPFDYVDLDADGVTTVSAPVVFDGSALGGYFEADGSQVKLMNNISGIDGAGSTDAAGSVSINAGPAVTDDYSVRVAAGKTISADSISVDGLDTDDAPNVILQGMLSGNTIEFGSSDYISDLFSGPAGGLETIGANPFVYVGFSGAVKTAKYNNSSNFRFNYLPINNAGDDSLALELDPVKFATNGTSNGLSAVNVLVNGDVDLVEGTTLGLVTPISGVGSAVTGVLNVPNTHLVVQSTGNITTNGGDYYWPGYVYLGNIKADADGNAQPGTLGLGTISLDGDFSNVLPGDIAGASGIHFITQFPLNIVGNVTTNANAWVNLGTDLLTTAYASGTLSDGQFFGGVKGSGNVVNYGELDAANFHTHAPDATK